MYIRRYVLSMDEMTHFLLVVGEYIQTSTILVFATQPMTCSLTLGRSPFLSWSAIVALELQSFGYCLENRKEVWKTSHLKLSRLSRVT